MDCNKEEAIRAKEIAAQKLERRDIIGARKFARKAQQLYPYLENISQLVIVCDVHCTAEQKLYGKEMDWYGILQLEVTANDATIKKQYRKLALQLHPDKNKFAGAEAAFKLIGEAQRVLLDREKRSEHDKLRVSVNKTAMRCPNQGNVHMNFNSVGRTNVRPSFTNLNPHHHQSRQQGLNGGRATFWTLCPFCNMRYLYYREVLNKPLRCQNCSRPFIGCEVDQQGTSQANNSSQQAFGQQRDGLNHHAFKVGVGSQSNFHAEKSNTEPFEKNGPADVSGKLNRKRRRNQVAESSESSDSVGSTDSDDDIIIGEDGFPDVQNHSTYREEHPRRSSRKRHQVSYNENVSDDYDDISRPLKGRMGNGSPCGAAESCGEAAKINVQNGFATDLKDDQEVKQDQYLHSEKESLNRNDETKEVRGSKAVGGSKQMDEALEHSTPDSTYKATDNPNVYIYPDAEFNDFDKDKKQECFAAGQIWAIYDPTDGMPRFYALIKKVLSPGFKLRITWFEPDPDDEDEINWLSEELPISCGKYTLGSTQITEDHPMFSHLILCEKISRNTFKVYPRKGETWALFKNWEIKWYKDVESHRQYEYEFVEILSDYVEGEGVLVAYLAKLKDFVSLFSQITKEDKRPFKIPPTGLFRFSHRVPSFKMTGEERVGVPRGSYELDPASLPMNIEEFAVPEYLEVEVGHSLSGNDNTRSSELKTVTTSEGGVSASKVNLDRSNEAQENKDFVDDCCAYPASTPEEAFEIPDPQFFNFDAGRSLEKFQIDQIWAFYSDEDGLPKYYGQIKKIETSPDFELHVTWLSSCWLPENAVRWEDKDMLITCGRFKLNRKGVRSSVYSNSSSVSHQVHADIVGKRNEFAILPRKGEVWALYRKWTSKIKYSDLPEWEYDVVEVLEESDSWINVLLLESLHGFTSVFRGQSNNGAGVTQRIPRGELLRFSHQIPAYKLTEEQNGNLRGFWELDPGALPIHYFRSK